MNHGCPSVGTDCEIRSMTPSSYCRRWSSRSCVVIESDVLRLRFAGVFLRQIWISRLLPCCRGDARRSRRVELRQAQAILDDARRRLPTLRPQAVAVHAARYLGVGEAHLVQIGLRSDVPRAAVLQVGEADGVRLDERLDPPVRHEDVAVGDEPNLGPQGDVDLVAELQAVEKPYGIHLRGSAVNEEGRIREIDLRRQLPLLEEAPERRVTVAFTGNGGGAAADVADLILLGPHGYSALVQEVHIAMGHIICDLVEQELLFS